MAHSNTKKKKGCLVGCLVVAAIIVVGVILVTVFIFLRGDDIMNSVLMKTKDSITYLLTEDHSDDEKKAFEMIFSEFIDEMQQNGLQQGVQNNQEAIKELQTILEDQRVTRRESQDWVRIYQANKKS